MKEVTWTCVHKLKRFQFKQVKLFEQIKVYVYKINKRLKYTSCVGSSGLRIIKKGGLN